MLKYATVGLLIYYLYTQREVIQSYIGNWVADKLDFQLISLTKPRYSVASGEVSFDVNIALNNFLQMPFTLDNLGIVLFWGKQQDDLTIWEEIARRDPNDTTKTINITPGTNQQTVKVTAPVVASARHLITSAIDRFLSNRKQQFKVKVSGMIDGKAPLETEQTFEL